MIKESDKQLERTKELFDFLKGKIPKGNHVARSHRPKLTSDQAWTVIWYLGNEYWQVPDYIERCEICGDLYHTWQEGDCLDYGKAPYNFCGNCMAGEEYAAKEKRNPSNRRLEQVVKEKYLDAVNND
jgi:hypothetical protein